MAQRVRIFSRAGKPLVDVECIASWSQLLNDIGRAEIAIGKSDSRVTEPNVRFGNRVLIEHDNGLKWGGVIDEPEPWGEDAITITAYTAELKLKQRNAYEDDYTGTAGSLFSGLIDDANRDEHTGITVQGIHSAGASWTEPIQDGNLYEILQRVQKRSGQEWSVEPRLDQHGNLVFDARWYSRRGSAWKFWLEEGVNIERGRASLLTIQGKIVNRWRIKGRTGSVESEATVNDLDSQYLYGLREDTAQVALPVGMTATDYGNVLLSQSKAPRRTYKLVALPVGQTFSYLGIGDTVYLKLLRYGFQDGGFGTETQVRVLARQYNEVDGKMALTVDEVV